MSHRKRMLRHGPRTGVLAASIGALIATGGLSTTAYGQDEDEADDANQDTIIVTGTRIRRDDFNAVTPTTVITAADMQNLGVVSVADMVNQLPGNIASVSPEATADSPYYLGASIANMRGLNTAFGVRTLTLVDSRRVTPTNNSGGVDMNFIPSALVGRIETVTGGASAAYGADAMAGVVNVILDDNVDNIRVDLNYQTSDDVGGDQYTFSFGTGAQFFEGRGQFTVGLDSSRQDAIEDCLTREVCQRGLGLFRNGVQSPVDFGMYSPRGDTIVYQGQPEWMLQEGHVYNTTPNGVTSPEQLEDLGYPCASMASGTLDVSACGGFYDPFNPDPVVRTNFERGWYQFNDQGTGLVPYMTPEQVTPTELLAVDAVGTQAGTGLGTISLQGSGNQWSTPYGGGRSIYSDVPINPETARDNLFARFSYELEGGIDLTTSLRYGETESESLQNAARNNLQGFCVMPHNAYLQEGVVANDGSGQLLRSVYYSRFATGFSDNGLAGFFVPMTFTPNPDVVGAGCSQAPFLGGSFTNRDPDEILEQQRYEFAPGMEFAKDFGAQVDRRNRNFGKSMDLSLSATGPLFDGGSWTWDAYIQKGKSESRQSLSSWRAARRWDMAIDTALEGFDTNGDGVVDTQDPMSGGEPVIVCSVDSQLAQTTDQDGNPVPVGDFIRSRWYDYIYQAESDRTGTDELDLVYAAFTDGCQPFNPFGSQPFTAEQQAFIFPALFEGTDNDQTSVSISFSGDAWRGIGNAGPMRMAAGVDWRENDTQNLADSTRFLGADFNFIGTSGSTSSDTAYTRIYGDNWFGRTTTEEAFVEFDLPLLRDKPGADFLSFSTAFRRTRNKTERISGIVDVASRNSSREVDSWRASMSWQPVDLLRVRMNRSADTRAPSANELFGTNSYATETGGALEIFNPFKFTVGGLGEQEQGDQIIVLQAGNASLQTERSITETLGLVFQPVETLPGLQVSVDYYQTTIEGGIREIDYNDTIDACFTEVAGPETDRYNGYPDNLGPWLDPAEQSYCPNIVFQADPDQTTFITGAREIPGLFQTQGALILGPDGVTPVMTGDPNPWAQYSNVVSIAESAINEEDYISRGIDYSVTYNTQLGGGGSISARALLTRFLEQRALLLSTFGPTDVSGQTGGNNIANYLGSFSTNYSPTPRIRGNLFMTYSKNAFSVTAQARYTGTGKLNVQHGWLAPPNDFIAYQPYLNQDPFGNPTSQYYDPDVERTVTDNELPSWTTLNLNFNYDFGRSRFQLDRFESLSAYLNIDNVGDRVPGFFSGTGAGGINTSLFSALGRQYRMGVRMEF